MGGVGKTTAAIALVMDEDIRKHFTKLLFISVGQEPEMRDLENSLHIQLTGKSLPETLTSPLEISAALRHAAKGFHVLQVIDDVWDAKHEVRAVILDSSACIMSFNLSSVVVSQPPLNVIDPDTPSKVLVTTRIRGLLKRSIELEVGLLGESAAVELLCKAGNIELSDDEEMRARCLEIVELCGRLALTVDITGGLICEEYGSEVDDDFVDSSRGQGRHAYAPR